jgi:hypothetical protein
VTSGTRRNGHLAESIALGGIHAETAVIRFGDGIGEALPASMFASSAPLITIFV